MLLAVLLAVDAALQPFVKVEAAALALEHVRIIDGTGAPPREDQTLFIAGGKLVAQAPGGPEPAGLCVSSWAGQGGAPLPSYNTLARPERGGASQRSHDRGLRFARRRCSAACPEVPRPGTDDLQNRLLVRTDFSAARK